MKVLVFLLVLANALFFAYTDGYFGHPENPDAARAEQQLSAERIRVIARGEPPSGSGVENPAPEPAAKAAPAEEPPPAQRADAGKSEPAAASTCLAWNNLSAGDADRLSALLSEKFEAFRQSRRLVAAEGSAWWVFIPPLASKADADKKAAELKNLGIADFFIIQDNGPNRFSVSLGVFSAESGARERLAELKSHGVKTARAGPRPGKDALNVLQAVGPTESAEAVREAVGGVLPKAVAGECP